MDTRRDMIVKLIESVFDKKAEYVGRWTYRAADNLYIMLEQLGKARFGKAHIAVWCAACPGGSYNNMGRIIIGDGNISIGLKTREGILNSRSEYGELSLSIADPEFCSKLLGIITKHAVLVLKACGDAHSASWRRYNNECLQRECSSGSRHD